MVNFSSVALDVDHSAMVDMATDPLVTVDTADTADTADTEDMEAIDASVSSVVMERWRQKALQKSRRLLHRK